MRGVVHSHEEVAVRGVVHSVVRSREGCIIVVRGVVHSQSMYKVKLRSEYKTLLILRLCFVQRISRKC